MNQKNVIAILGIITIALFCITVYFSTINKISEPVTQAPKVIQQPIQTPTPATQSVPVIIEPASETAKWRTYSNAKYGYEIKYPQNWNYKIENESVCFRENGKKYTIEGGDECGISVSESTNLDTERLGMYNWAKLKKEISHATITEMKIRGYDAVQSQDYLGVETIVGKPANNGLEIDIATPNFGEETRNEPIKTVYDKMLTTFKFTE